MILALAINHTGEDVVYEIACFFCHHAGLPPPPPLEELAACQSLEGVDSGGGQRSAPLLWATPLGDVLRSSQAAAPASALASLQPRPLWQILGEQAASMTSSATTPTSHAQLAGTLCELLGVTADEMALPPPHYRYVYVCM